MAENLDSKGTGVVPKKKRHNAHFRFSLRDFPVTADVDKPLIHDTNCELLPTSWRINIRFEEMSPNSCSVSINRTDSIDKPVDACVWVSCFDQHKRRLSYPRTFIRRGMLPSVEHKEYFRELIPEKELPILEEKKLIFEISAIISACHPKVGDSESDVDPDLSPMKCSKL